MTRLPLLSKLTSPGGGHDCQSQSVSEAVTITMVHTGDLSTIIRILSSCAQVLMVMVMIARDKQVQVSVRRSQSQWCIPVILPLALGADRKLRSFKWQSRVFRLLKVSKFQSFKWQSWVFQLLKVSGSMTGTNINTKWPFI